MSTTADGVEGGLGAVPGSVQGRHMSAVLSNPLESAEYSRLLAVIRKAEDRDAAAMAGKTEDETRAILERREGYQELIQDCIREMRRESNLEMRQEMRKKRMQDDAKKRTRERIDYDMRVRIPQTLARAYGLQMIAESC